MKIAIFGGSFNPIGNHHIDIANKLCNIVDEVWLLPCYKSTTGKKLESDSHRINMCNLAITKSGNPKIKLCLFEIDNKSDGKTYNVLKSFKKTFDTVSNKYYFVIGMDNALSINTWDDWTKLINKYPFIVLNRIGYISDTVDWFTKYPHIYASNIMTLDGSSTKIRNDLNNDVIPDIDTDVYDYIKTKELYSNL